MRITDEKVEVNTPEHHDISMHILHKALYT